MIRDVIMGAMVALIVNELTDLSPWTAIRMSRWAARKIYAASPDRAASRAEEWEALIKDSIPTKISQLFFGLGMGCAGLWHIAKRYRAQDAGWKAPPVTQWATAAFIAALATAVLAMVTGTVLLAFCGMPPGPLSPGPAALEQATRQLPSHGALYAAGGICLTGGFALICLIVLACSPFLWLKNTTWLR